MIKYVILLKRRPEVDHATFLKIWREDYLPILQRIPVIGPLIFDRIESANAMRFFVEPLERNS